MGYFILRALPESALEPSQGAAIVVRIDVKSYSLCSSCTRFQRHPVTDPEFQNLFCVACQAKPRHEASELPEIASPLRVDAAVPAFLTKRWSLL